LTAGLAAAAGLVVAVALDGAVVTAVAGTLVAVVPPCCAALGFVAPVVRGAEPLGPGTVVVREVRDDVFTPVLDTPVLGAPVLLERGPLVLGPLVLGPLVLGPLVLGAAEVGGAEV
jgi:hypothetical protein